MDVQTMYFRAPALATTEGTKRGQGPGVRSFACIDELKRHREKTMRQNAGQEGPGAGRTDEASSCRGRTRQACPRPSPSAAPVRPHPMG